MKFGNMQMLLDVIVGLLIWGAALFVMGVAGKVMATIFMAGWRFAGWTI